LLVGGSAALAKLGPDIHNFRPFFPKIGVVRTIVDGDSFKLLTMEVRLIGVDASEGRTEKGAEAKEVLEKLILKKRIWLEYDRSDDDKFFRALAWVWINCESEPKFLPWNYMKLSGNASKPGLTDNPQGCKKGKLVQEELLKKGTVQLDFFKDRGELKYQLRLQKLP